MEQIFEIIKWWLVLELIGILALPLSAYFFWNLPDRGLSVSKIVGILLFAYLTWILVTVGGFEYGNIVLMISLFFVSIISIFSYHKKGLNIKVYDFLLYELVFTFAFIVFLVIRSYITGDYFIVGEKFMDIAFINAVLKSKDFPFYDPWFVGANVTNYYYFGYLIIGSLMKLTGSNISSGFNIASSAFYAISSTAAFGIGYNLVSRIKGGIITSFFVTAIGNLVGFIQLIVIIFLPSYYNSYYVHGGNLSTRLSSFSLWPSEKVIPDTISQFPYFSFLIGDLHSNFIAISFQLLTIMIFISILKARDIPKYHLIFLGLAVGFFYPLNSWNYPVYVFLSLFILLLKKENLYKRFGSFVFVIVISLIAYIPYHLGFKNIHKISVVLGHRTDFIHYSLIFGLFLFLFMVFLAMESFKFFTYNIFRKKIDLATGIFLIIILSLILDFQLLILIIPLALSFSLLLKENDHARQIVFVLIAAGIVVSLFGEIFYIEDAFSPGPYYRFNMIFKLYDQIWILYAIAAAYIFYYSLHSHKRFAVISTILVVMSLVFPIAASYSKSSELNYPPTLDGEKILNMTYPYDYEAIKWFREIQGTQVVLEATGYTGGWNSYISAFTGLPTVLGWEWHEYQWRMNLEEINIRRSDVELAYTSNDYEEIKNIIYKYNIKYIYIGHVEQGRYRISNVFEQRRENFKLVFKNPEVKIYEVQ